VRPAKSDNGTGRGVCADQDGSTVTKEQHGGRGDGNHWSDPDLGRRGEKRQRCDKNGGVDQERLQDRSGSNRLPQGMTTHHPGDQAHGNNGGHAADKTENGQADKYEA
jgi:hypothetical protein